jgi:hypothetical protein
METNNKYKKQHLYERTDNNKRRQSENISNINTRRKETQNTKLYTG